MKSLQVLLSSVIVASVLNAYAPKANATDTTLVYDADTFVDQDGIESWSQIQIEALVEAGILVGYPDGTFQPNNLLTRAEFSVALYKAMDLMYSATESMNALNKAEAESRINALRTQVDALSLALDDSLLTLVEGANDSFVGLGISYAVDKASGTSAVITLLGKVQIVELSDKLALSARGFVNTDTVLGAGLTLDYDLTDKLEIYAGAGAAYVLDTNNVSALTGNNPEEVVPYANVGASYDLSNKSLVFVDGKIPLSVNNDETAEITAGLGFKF